METPRLWPAALALALVAGCGDGGGTAAVEAASTPEPVAVDESVRPALMEFLRRWCCGPSSEYPAGPATVAGAVERSTLVVLAKVGDVRPGYVHRRSCAPTQRCGDFDFALADVRLTDVRVLSGGLPEGSTDLVVQRLAGTGASTPDGVRRIRAELPIGGEAVWFLYLPGQGRGNPTAGRLDAEQTAYEGSRHAVVDSRAVFVQGADGVVAPMAEEEREYLPSESVLGLADRYERLSDLVADVRALDPADRA